jgi:hypothetical protein
VEWRINRDIEKDRMHSNVGKLTLLLTAFLELSSIIVIIHYFMFPDSNIHLLLTWMPSWLRTHWITYILYGALWCWIVLTIFSVINFLLVVTATYGVLIVPIVCRELVRGRVNGYKTKGLLRLLPKQLTLEYRRIEVIQLNLNELIGYTLILLAALVGETVVFSNFVLLTMWEELDGVTALVFAFIALAPTVTWGAFLEGFGMYNKRGLELLESWKLASWSSKRDRLWMEKFAKSCKPLGMRSKFFCVERLSSLKFVQRIVEGTLSLVLLN